MLKAWVIVMTGDVNESYSFLHLEKNDQSKAFGMTDGLILGFDAGAMMRPIGNAIAHFSSWDHPPVLRRRLIFFYCGIHGTILM